METIHVLERVPGLMDNERNGGIRFLTRAGDDALNAFSAFSLLNQKDERVLLEH